MRSANLCCFILAEGTNWDGRPTLIQYFGCFECSCPEGKTGLSPTFSHSRCCHPRHFSCTVMAVSSQARNWPFKVARLGSLQCFHALSVSSFSSLSFSWSHPVSFCQLGWIWKKAWCWNPQLTKSGSSLTFDCLREKIFSVSYPRKISTFWGWAWATFG